MQRIKFKKTVIGIGDVGDVIECKMSLCGKAIIYDGLEERFIMPDDFEIVFDRSASEFLSAANNIMQQRAKQYDKPDGERSMDATIKAFNAVTGRDLTESDGWLLMLILKNVRQWQKPDYHADSAEDAVAYSALLAEALAKGK